MVFKIEHILISGTSRRGGGNCHDKPAHHQNAHLAARTLDALALVPAILLAHSLNITRCHCCAAFWS
jgi:hypothetical protein